MKKIISAILAALMLFSAFSMNPAAQTEESGYDLCIITVAHIYLNGERSVKEFVEWLDNETAQLKKEDGGILSGNDLIPTGATLKYIDGEDKKEYTFILPGDVNRDGKIQIKDARIVLRIAVGIEELKGFLAFMASNVYNNIESYEINIADAKAILRYSVHILLRTQTVDNFCRSFYRNAARKNLERRQPSCGF